MILSHHKAKWYQPKICYFIRSWEMHKTTIKLCKRFFFHKIKRIMGRKPGMKYFVHSRLWSHLRQVQNCNFITLWELIKTPQSFEQGPSCIKSIKLCHKNRGGLLASDPLLVYFLRKQKTKDKDTWFSLCLSLLRSAILFQYIMVLKNHFSSQFLKSSNLKNPRCIIQNLLFSSDFIKMRVHFISFNVLFHLRNFDKVLLLLFLHALQVTVRGNTGK